MMDNVVEMCVSIQDEKQMRKTDGKIRRETT